VLKHLNGNLEIVIDMDRLLGMAEFAGTSVIQASRSSLSLSAFPLSPLDLPGLRAYASIDA
jgi:hypothetical protein